MNSRARGDLPPVAMHWYDGGKKPAANCSAGEQVAGNGAIFVGEQGTLYSIEWTGADWRLLPEEKFRDHKPPRGDGAAFAGPSRRVDPACKGGPAAYCNFVDFAAKMTEVMLLGGLALRAASGSSGTPPRCATTNCPEADALIDRRTAPAGNRCNAAPASAQAALNGRRARNARRIARPPEPHSGRQSQGCRSARAGNFCLAVLGT